jgi:hypothetical protein
MPSNRHPHNLSPAQPRRLRGRGRADNAAVGDDHPRILQHYWGALLTGAIALGIMPWAVIGPWLLASSQAKVIRG